MLRVLCSIFFYPVGVRASKHDLIGQPHIYRVYNNPVPSKDQGRTDIRLRQARFSNIFVI